MVIWITGAKGFIGYHVAYHFSARGEVIAGLGHESEKHGGMMPNLGHWVVGDVTGQNLYKLYRLSGCPELIVHLAGGASVGASIANPSQDFQRTVTSTAELLEWMRLYARNARLVFISSAAIYGDNASEMISEDEDVQPISPYGFHKYMGEQLCRSYAISFGLNCLILRLFSVYGINLRKQLLWELCTRLHNGSEGLVLAGTGDEIRDWINVLDVVQAIEKTAPFASQDVPVFNVGSGQPITVRNIAEMIIEAWPKRGKHSHLSFNHRTRIGDPFRLVADTARLEARGFKCTTPLKAGIDAYLKWFLSLSEGRNRL